MAAIEMAPEIVRTIELTKDAVSLMIPVITGFIVLFGSALGKLLEPAQGVPKAVISSPLTVVSFLSSVVSLFMCFGAMSLCLKASIGEPASFYFLSGLEPKELIVCTRKLLYVSSVVFAVSIVTAALVYSRILRRAGT